MPIYKMKGKKEGRQKYRVRINYIDGAGNYKQLDRAAFGLDEAKLLEMKLIRKYRETTPIARMSVNDLYTEYMKMKKHEVRKSSYDKSKQIISCNILPVVGNLELQRLTTRELQAWKLKIEERLLASTTKQNIYTEFRTLLNYAVKMEYLQSNPLIRVGNFKSDIAINSNIQYYTADEFHEFIACAKENGKLSEKQINGHEWHYYVFFAIAFYTGLRKGEIHALTWLDIVDSYLSVTKSLSQKLGGGDLITAPKNQSSVRTLQLPFPLLEILKKHRHRCSNVSGFNESSFICGGNKPLRDSTIWQRSKLFAEQAGIKRIRIHDFRHSHASLLANAGINIQEVARRLGHAKVEMTWNTYSHLYPREEERAVEILNKIM